jgi:hypothetical protein
VTGRLWTYVRDDRPFGGTAAPAAVFFYSRDRAGEHVARHLASYAGILQADAYSGFGQLYNARRSPGPITEAACWAHTIRTQSRWGPSPRAGRGSSERDDMLDLQIAVMDDNAFDHQL